MTLFLNYLICKINGGRIKFFRGGLEMSLYFMFGKYSSEAVEKISKERTIEVNKIVNQFGGEIKAMYVLMGAYDLVLITGFPNMKEALQASIAITKISGISFSTLPAMPVDEFDELLSNK